MRNLVEKIEWREKKIIADIEFALNSVTRSCTIEIAISVWKRGIGRWFSFLTAEQFVVISPGGGDSYMEQTGMLVGNFEFNP